MPRQQAPYATRTSVEQMNLTAEQVAQFYETAGDRNSAFGTEDIPQGLITHLASPPSEDVRWSRHDGDAWIAAMLPPTINCGWTSNLVVADRTDTVKLTATIRLNEAVPAGKTYTVSYKTTDGTATSAENDFTAIPLTAISFAEGEREKTVEISVTGKGTTPQPPEQFYLDLSSPSEGSATFGIGSRLTVSLTGDTSLLVLRLADARCDEGQAASVVASINREATGDVAFTWSTRQQTSPINRAPASVYTAVASATARIPEGATSTNLIVQTVEVNAQVTARNQNFEVVVPQASLMVDGGDAFATAGHDLVSSIEVVRNQYVAPTNTVPLPPQWASQNRFYTRYKVTTNSPKTNPTTFGTLEVAFQNPDPDGSGNITYTRTDLSGYDRTTYRNNPMTWPSVGFAVNSTESNQLAGAHFYCQLSGAYVSDNSTSTWYLLQPREVRVEFYGAGGTGWDLLEWTIDILPRPSDGADAFYSKATYDNLQLRLSGTIYTLTLVRGSGVRFAGNAESVSRAYTWPSS